MWPYLDAVCVFLFASCFYCYFLLLHCLIFPHWSPCPIPNLFFSELCSNSSWHLGDKGDIHVPLINECLHSPVRSSFSNQCMDLGGTQQQMWGRKEARDTCSSCLTSHIKADVQELAVTAPGSRWNPTKLFFGCSLAAWHLLPRCAFVHCVPGPPFQATWRTRRAPIALA